MVERFDRISARPKIIKVHGRSTQCKLYILLQILAEISIRLFLEGQRYCNNLIGENV